MKDNFGKDIIIFLFMLLFVTPILLSVILWVMCPYAHSEEYNFDLPEYQAHVKQIASYIQQATDCKLNYKDLTNEEIDSKFNTI